MIKSFVVVERQEKFLLIQEAGRKWHGRWFLPGGKLKKGESPENACKRETKEESGFAVDPHQLFLCKYYTGYFSQKLYLFYKGDVTTGKLKQYEDKHSLKAGWFSMEEIRGMSTRAGLLNILQTYQRGKENGMRPENFRVIEL